MLRVNIGLSRKLSKDFNSSGYSINLDGEITAPVNDPEGVTEQVKELFDLAEEALAQQIERSEGDQAVGSRDAPRGREPSGTNGREHQSGQASGAGGSRTVAEEEPATNKQIQYLLSLGKRHRLTTIQLEGRIREILGRPVEVYDLTKKSAASVIDALSNGQKNVAAASRN